MKAQLTNMGFASANANMTASHDTSLSIGNPFAQLYIMPTNKTKPSMSSKRNRTIGYHAWHLDIIQKARRAVLQAHKLEHKDDYHENF